MGTLHKLLVDYGREQAMMMTDPEDRHLVRVAADILAEEDDAIGVTYSGFCQASLPHKRLPNDKEWIQQSERLTLMIEPGRMLKPGTVEGEFIGVPYGSRARLILLYLQTRLRASHNCGTKCHVPAFEEGVETAETPRDGFRASWLVAA